MLAKKIAQLNLNTTKFCDPLFMSGLMRQPDSLRVQSR